MPDLKISAMTNGAPIVDTDVFPFVRSGANYKGTGADLVTYTFTKSNIEVITEAALQAKALAGTVVPLRTYAVTKTVGIQAQIFVVGFSVFTCYEFCRGRMKNAVMAAFAYGDMHYDLPSGTILDFYDPIKGNKAIGYSGVNEIPLDDVNVNRNVFNNMSSVIGTFSTTQFEDNYIDSGAIISCENASQFSFSEVGKNATCMVGTVSACVLFQSHIYGALTLADGVNAGNWTLGLGKTIDTTGIAAGYAPTNSPSYTDQGSTFVCDTIKDMDGQTEIDLTDLTGIGDDYRFCGIFTLTTGGAGGDTVTLFTGSQEPNHNYLFYWNINGKSLIWDGSSFGSGGVDIIMNSTGDQVELQWNPLIPKYVQAGNTFIQ